MTKLQIKGIHKKSICPYLYHNWIVYVNLIMSRELKYVILFVKDNNKRRSIKFIGRLMINKRTGQKFSQLTKRPPLRKLMHKNNDIK